MSALDFTPSAQDERPDHVIEAAARDFIDTREASPPGHPDATRPVPRPALTSARPAPDAPLPPHNNDAEQGLLASCMLENGPDIISECLAADITPDYFFRPAHGLIYGALVELFAANIPAEEILVANKLDEKGCLDAAGGHPYLYELTGRIQTTVHARHWMKIVRKKHLLRELIRAAQQTVELCHGSADLEIDEFLGEVEARFMSIHGQRGQENGHPVTESVKLAEEKIAQLMDANGRTTGLPTGFSDFDRMTFGLQAKEVIILAGRPSSGKSALAGNIIENVLLPRDARARANVLLFSIEMSHDSFIQRIITGRAQVSTGQLQRGMATAAQRAAMITAANELRGTKLWTEDVSNITITQMRARARRRHQRDRLHLIVVDYLQLVGGGSARHHSREQEIAEVSRGLKAMAKELEVPILALCQLNREAEKDNRTPRLSDLRESGTIEMDADVVAMLSRTREKKDEVEDDDSVPVQRLLNIAKNRNGPIGEVILSFNKRWTRFSNYSHFNAAIAG